MRRSIRYVLAAGWCVVVGGYFAAFACFAPTEPDPEPVVARAVLPTEPGEPVDPPIHAMLMSYGQSCGPYLYRMTPPVLGGVLEIHVRQPSPQDAVIVIGSQLDHPVAYSNGCWLTWPRRSVAAVDTENRNAPLMIRE